jgi:hypothetical protein
MVDGRRHPGYDTQCTVLDDTWTKEDQSYGQVKFDNKVCFEETYSYSVYSDMSDIPKHRNLGVIITIIVD